MKLYLCQFSGRHHNIFIPKEECVRYKSGRCGHERIQIDFGKCDCERVINAGAAMRYARKREHAIIELIKQTILLDKSTCAKTYNNNRMLCKGFNRSLLICEEAQRRNSK